MIRNSDTKFALRREVALYALEKGVKPTARHFSCSKNTVRKWLRRYKQLGNKGLKACSRAPKSCPHKTDEAVAKQVIECRKRAPGFGARRLVEEFDLPLGHNAAHRILTQAGLIQPRKRRYQTKRDLRAIKAAYPAFRRFMMDVKHLCDIPHYWLQMQALGLPRFQYTLRELSAGAQFLTYANELSKTYATLTIERFLKHLKAHGISTAEVILKTDLGAEFDGDTHHYRPEGFHRTVQRFGAQHRFNPPSCPNANADVESIHATIEPEFFNVETFNNREEFFSKIATYQLWYNLARKNRSRAWRSPLDILQQKDSSIPASIFLLAPIPVELLLDPSPPLGGHLVPGSPEFLKRPGRVTYGCRGLIPESAR